MDSDRERLGPVNESSSVTGPCAPEGGLGSALAYFKELGIEGLSIRAKAQPMPVVADSSAVIQQLQKIRSDIGDCQRCKLCSGRTHIVFGVGNPTAELMFVGEGPGRDEDLQGEPFVGRAGQLLTKIIEAMGMQRSDVYIANVVKCRPPDNRLPEPDEVTTCYPFLYQQITAIRPKIIVTLGSLATQTLLGTKTGITQLRGKFSQMKGLGFGGQGMERTKILPTFHPAYLLRNPPMKKLVWEDMKLVMATLKE